LRHLYDYVEYAGIGTASLMRRESLEGSRRRPLVLITNDCLTL
jgi:hypothetical protein